MRGSKTYFDALIKLLVYGRSLNINYSVSHAIVGRGGTRKSERGKKVVE